MQFVIGGIFVLIVAFLVWRSKNNIDPVEQACASEIGALFKSNRDPAPQAIADIFMKHNIPRSQCPRVGRMVIAQLNKNGLEPDDSRIAMIKVREAYTRVP
jgi:hypothetical protein